MRRPENDYGATVTRLLRFEADPAAADDELRAPVAPAQSGYDAAVIAAEHDGS